MSTRKEFEMSPEWLEKLLEAGKPIRVMYLPGGALMGSTPQENANAAWAALGREMGFKAMTVQPSGKGDRFFTAEPVEEQTT